MATASVTNTFANSTTADATEVNTNFSDLVTFLNNSVVHLDGSKTLTGTLVLAATGLTFTGGITVSDVKDEDNMATDSATMLATQQSIKAYVDTTVVAREHHWMAGEPSGDVAVTTTGTRIYNNTGKTLTVTFIAMSASVAPTGASIIGDVHMDGTTLFTTQGNRPTISAAGFESTETDPDIVAWTDGAYLEFLIDQVGSTEPGEDVVWYMRYTEPA
jgi:hypothetical protein